MATQIDEVQSIFDEVESSSKVEESNTVSFSYRRGSRPARAVNAHVLSSRSKSTKQRGRPQNIGKKSVTHEKETTGPGGKADVFPENQQQEPDVQAGSNKGMGVDAFIPEKNEEAKLSFKVNQSLSRPPLRKQFLTEVDERLEVKEHSTHQNLNHVEEDISNVDTKAAEAGFSEQMKQEQKKLLNNKNLSVPRKRKRRIAKYTARRNTKISEGRPKRTKQQSRLNSSLINRVKNSPDDSKNIADVKEIMKDMSKLLPRVVLERVSVSRIAAPSELQLAEEHKSFANHAKEELPRAEAASSLEQGGNATSAELGSLCPTDEDCMILDVFLSADKKEGDGRPKNTVIGQSATEPEIVSEESVTKEKSCKSENTSNAVAVDSLAVIVDVNLDICVDDGGHVEIQDVKITGRKRSGSRQEEKSSPEVKPLRGRRVRTPKAMAVEPVRKEERIAYSRRKLAEPSLDPLPSSNGTDVTEKSEATLSLGTTVKENVVHENAMTTSEEKSSHVEEQEGPSASVAGLPDNIEIAKENDVDAGSSIANREEIKIVHLEEASSCEEKDLLTTVKPPKLRRGRGGRVKVAAREPTTGKIKSVVGQSSDAETTNCSAVSEQTNMEESATLTVNTSRCTGNATSSSEIKMNLNLFVQMTRVPEVEALAAALKLEGSKTSAKRPRRNVSDASTSPGVELSTASGFPGISLKRVRKKKKFF